MTSVQEARFQLYLFRELHILSLLPRVECSGHGGVSQTDPPNSRDGLYFSCFSNISKHSCMYHVEVFLIAWFKCVWSCMEEEMWCLRTGFGKHCCTVITHSTPAGDANTDGLVIGLGYLAV